MSRDLRNAMVIVGSIVLIGGIAALVMFLNVNAGLANTAIILVTVFTVSMIWTLRIRDRTRDKNDSRK